MDQWKSCPECGSSNIHCDIGVNTANATFERSNSIVVNTNIFSLVEAALDLFVCVDCGNVRLFLSKPEDQDVIKHLWPRADSLMQVEPEITEDDIVRHEVKESSDG